MSTIDSASFEERLRQYNLFKTRFPNSVPIVIQRDSRSSLPLSLQNQLFLVPRTLSATEFSSMIRKKVNLAKTQAMMMFVNRRTLVAGDLTVSELYDRFRGEDGFLYVLCTDHASYGT